MRSTPRPFPTAFAVTAIVTVMSMIITMLPLAPGVRPVSAEEARLHNAMAMSFGAQILQASPEDELDGIKVEPIDPSMDPADVLKLRPFIVTERSLEILSETPKVRAKELDNETAIAKLVSFLSLRGVDQATIDEAVRRFKDRKVRRIIPALNLRAALLMLSGWEPYDSAIAAVLDGKNPSGKPYAGVIFEDVGIEGAIATLWDDPDTKLHTMIFDKSYEQEEPEVLISTIVHETLHGGGTNSAEEEIFAGIIDAICWAEVLAVSPESALTGSDLAYNNNVKLIALLNSSGRNGPGAVGVATSPYGEVFIGEGLDGFDAESIRWAIEADWFYDALRNTGSEGQETTAAHLKRYPGGKALAETPRYSEEALAAVDLGVHKIVSPALAVRLAGIFELEVSRDFSEGEPKGDASGADMYDRRAFVPTEEKLFSHNLAKKTGKPLIEEDARAALETSFNDRDVDPALADQLLARFDDPATKELIPDPSLRAATVLLGGVIHFDVGVSAILDGQNSDGVPLQVFFIDMRDSAPTQRQSDWKDEGIPPAILVNSLLEGESPQLLASVLVEALFLHDDMLTNEEAISAAAFGTLAWAEIISLEPKAASARTWGVIHRNRYALAMLNSTSFDSPIGITGTPKGVTDILPGVFEDATSFVEYIELRPWGVRFNRQTTLQVPEVFTQFLNLAGVEPRAGMGGIIAYDERTLQDLDFAIDWYLTPEKVEATARALKLGTAKA